MEGEEVEDEGKDDGDGDQQVRCCRAPARRASLRRGARFPPDDRGCLCQAGKPILSCSRIVESAKMDQTYEQDPNLASELRDGAGRHINEEAAEDERMTALHDRRKFSLSDLAKEMANRGDRASVEYGGHSFSGAVVSAGNDYAVIEGSGLRSEIRLDSGYWSLIPAVQGATPGTTTNETLVARLHEHADTRAMVRIAIPNGLLVIGKVTVVGDDHIEMSDADERRIYVPLTMVLAVTKSIEFH